MHYRTKLFEKSNNYAAALVVNEDSIHELYMFVEILSNLFVFIF